MGRRVLVGSDTGVLVGGSLFKRKHPRGAGSLPTRACRLHERRRNSARPEVELDGASRRPRPESDFAFVFICFLLASRVLVWVSLPVCVQVRVRVPVTGSGYKGA